MTAPDELPEELAVWRRQPKITPGILFPLQGPTGKQTVQYRPDEPVEIEGETRRRKYLFPKGGPTVLSVHPEMVSRLPTASTVVVVEGTKQHLAAVSYAGARHLVVGMAGCWSWRSDGLPLEDWSHLPIEGADVVVALDSDISTNPHVWKAAAELKEHLQILGASSVRFLSLPTSGTSGLDDYLSTVAEGQRQTVLERMIDRSGDLPKSPPVSSAAANGSATGFVASGRTEPQSLVSELRSRGHHALGPGNRIWTYDPSIGVYVDDELALISASSKLLGDHYRRTYHRTALELLAAELAAEGLRLPEAPIGRLVAVSNGMLDVRTGTRTEHNPNHLAFARLTVPWDPEASSPRFDEWLSDRCDAQAEDLLETLGLLLVPCVGQRRVPFLFGPSRSGKGTLMRLVESMIPAQHRSAVTLQDLGKDRFAIADLHGKILNSAGDLSDAHVGDLSIFKTLTGDDTVSGQHKFGARFTFRNSALLWFSANALPTVDESSNAYLNRMRPFEFPRSFEGEEDPDLERALLTEAPGILVRLVDGAQRWIKRNGYAPVNPLVADRFAEQSDPVRMFIAEELEPAVGRFLSAAQAFQQYEAWAHLNNRHPLGKSKLLEQLDRQLGARRRERADGTGSRGWRDWSFRSELNWRDFVGPSVGRT